MRKLVDLGLEKIPLEGLLSQARQENGALKAYVSELEDKLEAARVELESLKAYISSDMLVLSKTERKRMMKEIRREEYIQMLISQVNSVNEKNRLLQRDYLATMRMQRSQIMQLHAILEQNGISYDCSIQSRKPSFLASMISSQSYPCSDGLKDESE